MFAGWDVTEKPTPNRFKSINTVYPRAFTTCLDSVSQIVPPVVLYCLSLLLYTQDNANQQGQERQTSIYPSILPFLSYSSFIHPAFLHCPFHILWCFLISLYILSQCLHFLVSGIFPSGSSSEIFQWVSE